MKTHIRYNIWETNSSSCHSMVIVENDKAESEIPKEITVELGKFGWEEHFYSDFSTKLSWIYTVLQYLEDTEKRQEYIDKLKTSLEINGVETITFEDPEEDTDEFGWHNWYVDHGDEYVQEVLDLFENNDLHNFLYCSKSYLHTDNDNKF